MGWHFRQGIGGQSFLSSLGQGVGGVIDGRMVFHGGGFQSRDFDNKTAAPDFAGEPRVDRPARRSDGKLVSLQGGGWG